MSKLLIVIGIDAAFAHIGYARALVDTNSGKIKSIERLKLVTTEGRDNKTVRKSSDDLRRAREHISSLKEICAGADIAMAEIPHGSQSARASWSLGIAVGVVASCPIPMIEVSALEVKLASVGKKTASKDEIIKWAMKLYPHKDWLLNKGRPILANEHLADAVAVIHAGMNTETFKLLLNPFHGYTPRRRIAL